MISNCKQVVIVVPFHNFPSNWLKKCFGRDRRELTIPHDHMRTRKFFPNGLSKNSWSSIYFEYQLTKLITFMNSLFIVDKEYVNTYFWLYCIYCQFCINLQKDELFEFFWVFEWLGINHESHSWMFLDFFKPIR